MNKKKMIKSIENDLYDQIIAFFEQKPTNQKTEIEKWKYQVYLKLMKMMDQPEEKLVVRNAILLILSLFNDIPADIYDSKGIELSDISSPNQKREIISRLKEEID
ncbi:MAG: hypothetical protein EU547_02750 [Promethearchaeota archaeon]|nr:MAG: hypothetical protein EU547_02750 [Candidatus Lokiarchaeota archaeon]